MVYLIFLTIASKFITLLITLTIPLNLIIGLHFEKKVLPLVDIEHLNLPIYQWKYQHVDRTFYSKDRWNTVEQNSSTDIALFFNLVELFAPFLQVVDKEGEGDSRCYT